MTIYDLRCDVCGRPRPAPGGAVRFSYHPGVPELRDDSGLACRECWHSLTAEMSPDAPAAVCARCAAAVTRRQSLHLRRFDDPRSWRLCAAHAVEFLNCLRTVAPKLDPAAFRFPGAGLAGAPGESSG